MPAKRSGAGSDKAADKSARGGGPGTLPTVKAAAVPTGSAPQPVKVGGPMSLFDVIRAGNKGEVSDAPVSGEGGITIPADVADAIAEIVRTMPEDGSKVWTAPEPGPTKGSARSTAYAIREALHERGLFVRTFSKPVDPAKKDGPYTFGVKRVTEDRYTVRAAKSA